MDIQLLQEIRILQKFGSETAAIISNQPAASSSRTSSWKKFASETTTYQMAAESDFVEAVENMKINWDHGNYEEVLKCIDIILDSDLPELDTFVRSSLISAKSKCYEELGRMDLSLVEIEKAIAQWDGHERSLEELPAQIDLMDSLQMRRAALLLHNNRAEEAFAILQERQPKSIGDVLLYHFLDKKCKISLFNLVPASDENDLMALFIAGRYEEVIEKTRGIKLEDASYFEDAFPVRLHAASLAMLGKTEEALEYYRERQAYCTFEGDQDVYMLIQALNGDSDIPSRMDFEKELGIGYPVHLFISWIMNQHT